MAHDGTKQHRSKGHQPAISKDVRCCIASAQILARELSCCETVPDREALTTVIIPALTAHPTRDLPTHLAHTVAEHAAARRNIYELGVNTPDRFSEHNPECSRFKSGEEDTYQRVYDTVHTQLLDLPDNQDIDAVAEELICHGYDAEQLINELVVRETHRHTGLLHKEISKLRNSYPETRSEDLLGFAWKGLRVAIRSYDPRLGFAFSTYACPKINGAIRDGVRSESHLPKRLTTLVRSISTASEELTQKLSRTPTLDEISEYLGAPQAALAPRLTTPASIDELTDTNCEYSWNTPALIDNTNPQDAVEALIRDESVNAALKNLDQEAQHVMSSLYYEGKTLTATAKDLNLDIRIARKIRDESLTTLRAELTAWAK